MKCHLLRAVSVLLGMLLAPPAAAQDVKLMVPRRAEAMMSVSLSADGKIAATANTFDVKVWEVETGKELRRLWAPGLFFGVALSHDGKTVAGSSPDGVRIWNTSDGSLLRTLTTEVLSSVAISREGRTLVTVGPKSLTYWDVTSGNQLRSFATGASVPRTPTLLALSADGQTAILASDNVVKVWHALAGDLGSLVGHSARITSVAMTPDGKTAISGGLDNIIRIWDVGSTSQEMTLTAPSNGVTSLAISADGRLIAGGARDGTVTVWDVPTGRDVRTFSAHKRPVWSVALSQNGAVVVTGCNDDMNDRAVKVWNTATGTLLHSMGIQGSSGAGSLLSLSPDGRTLMNGWSNGRLTTWDLVAGRAQRMLSGEGFGTINQGAAVSEDGRTAIRSLGNAVTVWDVAAGNPVRTLVGHTDLVTALAVSQDGRTLATGSQDGSVRVWDVGTGKERRLLRGHSETIHSVAVSNDGTVAVSTSEDNTVRIWDVAAGQARHVLTGLSMQFVGPVAISDDMTTVAAGDSDYQLRVWDVTSGNVVRTWTFTASKLTHSLVLSRDGRTLASRHSDGVRVLDVPSGSAFEVPTQASASAVTLRGGSTLVLGESSGRISLWDLRANKALVDLYELGEEWVAVDPAGRFDGSVRGLEQLYWVSGFESFDLAQLKERYYEPGLVAKVLGFNKEPLRDVAPLTDVALFPSVEVGAVSDTGRLNLTLTNRGGGIGRVQVFVNDSELAADARGPQANPRASTATVTVDLSAAKNVLPGQTNQVRVVTWNGENWLSSRGIKANWTPPGKASVSAPALYAIVGGISTYSADHLSLRFAAKDATDIARALALGGGRLFGAEKVHITVLATGTPTAGPRGIAPVAPSKTNFQRAFQEVAKQARPQDIVLVYLAGHGVTLGRGSDEYAYLTAEARSTDVTVLVDPGVRARTAITSTEMAEWIKAIPAQKQILVLDTCAAAAVAASLVEKRSLDGDQIRAIDRLQGRTGLHVLMGSAADAASYEATQYGQGLLTYALLRGMKGAALREESYVDVSRLFQYAKDEVPKLAGSIGGIQDPRYMAPRQAESFDIGLLRTEDKAQIPLASARPMVLRPTLMNPVERFDNLELTKAFKAKLNDESYASARRGAASGAIYVDADELPGAVRPTGTYRIVGDRVVVSLLLRRDQTTLADLTVEGTRRDLPGLTDRLVTALRQALEKPQR
jgi:WD40 repeat protein